MTAHETKVYVIYFKEGLSLIFWVLSEIGAAICDLEQVI